MYDAGVAIIGHARNVNSPKIHSGKASLRSRHQSRACWSFSGRRVTSRIASSFPAIYNLAHEGQLPPSFAVVGFARRPKTHEQFRAELHDAVAEHSRFQPINPAVWDALAQGIFYHQSEFGDAKGYKSLDQFLKKLDNEHGTAGNRLFYLAAAPTEFEEIINQLGANDLVKSQDARGASRRIIVEKPFGSSLSTAQKLNRILAGVFGERQVFRIDHYLGKETVQNILALRFANEIFEPLWNAKYVDHVQITVAESLGVEGRGAYYDHAGALARHGAEPHDAIALAHRHGAAHRA